MVQKDTNKFGHYNNTPVLVGCCKVLLSDKQMQHDGGDGGGGDDDLNQNGVYHLYGGCVLPVSRVCVRANAGDGSAGGQPAA